MPILPIMFLIMFTLKITEVIAISWWWVCAPLFVIPLAIFIFFAFMMMLEGAGRR